MVHKLGEEMVREQVLPHTRLGRLIRPEEIADAICFMIANSALSQACPYFPGRDRRNRRKHRFAGCRLGNVGGKARLSTPLDVFFLSVAAERHAGQRKSSLAKLPHQVVAAAVGQAKIAHQQIEVVAAGQF